MDRRLNGQDVLVQHLLVQNLLKKLVSTNICPYFENPNEDSSGKYVYTRVILKLQINCSCVWEQTHEIYLAIQRIL